jgi:alpha-tubulin suppressor-like RCC1 family protein
MRHWRCACLFVGLASILLGQIKPALSRKTAADAISPPLGIRSIAASSGRSLALASDGTVWEWGAGCVPLGLGSSGATPVLQLSRPAPTLVNGLRGVVSVSSSYYLNLAAQQDGTVWAWGDAAVCGRTTAWAAPVRVSGITDAVAVAAGSSYYGAALKRDGTVWAWGWIHASYATSTGVVETAEPTAPLQVSGLAGAVQMAVGAGRGVVLKNDGTVWIWSQSLFGQPVATQVNGLGGVTAVAPGSAAGWALKGDGTVWTWVNYSANGTPVAQPVAERVSGISGVVALAADEYGRTVMAVKGDGTVWSWGQNHYGQLGDGTTADRPAPVQVNGLAGVVAVATGGTHSVALTNDGVLWAWGDNQYGQLGVGTPQPPPITPVSDLAGTVAMAVGPYNSLALKGDGSVWQWGAAGSLWFPDSRATPAQIRGLPGAAAIASGFGQNLALASDGTVWEWGVRSWPEPAWGQPAPLPVGGLSAVKAIAAGGTHNLALQDDGTVWAWGDNRYGQLGDGTKTARPAPVQVSGLSGVVAIAAGGVHSLALKADGSVWQWGDTEHKNLYCSWYEDAATPQLAPAQVSGLSGIVAISASKVMADGATFCDHNLALKRDGTVWAWGVNLAGGLGDGTTTDRSTPVPVSGIERVVAVAAGGGLHSLAVKDDGTAWTWGANYAAQLGDGTIAGRLTPARVGGLAGVVAVAGAAENSLALLHDGTVWGWGTNGPGQLGYENDTNTVTPVRVVPPGSPDLSLAVSHDGDFSAGGRGVYNLTATNIGLAPTEGTITVRVDLPPGVTFHSARGADWACTAAGQLVTCASQGPVGPQASSAITLAVDVGASACPGGMSCATVLNRSDPNASNNTTWDPTVVLHSSPGPYPRRPR